MDRFVFHFVYKNFTRRPCWFDIGYYPIHRMTIPVVTQYIIRIEQVQFIIY